MDAAVHLVLRDADPNGLVTATRDNWTGKAYSLPLADLKLLNGIINGAGVYVLDGIIDDGSNSQVIYIGEAEDILKRLTSKHQQLSKKDILWQRVVIFLSVGEDLHKGHVKWLESKLIEKAKKSGKAEITNDTAPVAPALPQPDLVFTKTFLQNMLVLYPLLGINIFTKNDDENKSTDVTNEIYSEELYLFRENEKIAKGRITKTGGIVILANSKIYKNEPSYITKHTHIVKARNFIKENNMLEEFDDNYYILKDNYELTSPSTAAAVVTGKPENGRVKWKNIDGKTYDELYNFIKN